MEMKTERARRILLETASVHELMTAVHGKMMRLEDNLKSSGDGVLVDFNVSAGDMELYELWKGCLAKYAIEISPIYVD